MSSHIGNGENGWWLYCVEVGGLKKRPQATVCGNCLTFRFCSQPGAGLTRISSLAKSFFLFYATLR